MPILTPLERIGTRIADKYELTAMLGRGGMGVVYQAVHRWTGRRVAVKVIDPQLADDPELGARFLNEARAAAAIAHAHVVDVLDMGRDEDGTVYQALELLEGETLSERLRRDGPMSAPETVRLLVPVMDALDCAHRAGIVHRDVKPGNVFLRNKGAGNVEAVLLDFGMAKLLDGQAVTTRSSTVLGTPHYMAPEQALASADVGPPADLWAMGTILFECLSGKLPFGEGPPAAYLARVVYHQAPTLSSFAAHVPASLAQAVDRALAREPSQRQRSMAALIEEVVASVPGMTKPESPATRTLKAKLHLPVEPHKATRPRWLAVALVLLVSGAVGLWLTREPALSAAGIHVDDKPSDAQTAVRPEPGPLPAHKPGAEPSLPVEPQAQRPVQANAAQAAPGEGAENAAPRPPAPEVKPARASGEKRKPARTRSHASDNKPPPHDNASLPSGMTPEW